MFCTQCLKEQYSRSMNRIEFERLTVNATALRDAKRDSKCENRNKIANDRQF